MAQIESLRDALRRRGVDMEPIEAEKFAAKLVEEHGIPAAGETWLEMVEAAADGYIEGQRAYDEEHNA